MSILNFPRVFFNGKMRWNPPTANNNDVLPVYDAVNVDLNWPFFADLNPPITPDNVEQTLQPWQIKMAQAQDLPDYVINVPSNSGNLPIMPAEWDLFGDNACDLVDYKQTHSRIIGGQTASNNYIDDDPLVGLDFQILGNPFGGTEPTPGRFVDISPWENTFTALYFDKILLGNQDTGIELNRQYRMLDRMLNFNWGAINGLTTVTTTWQSCFSPENIRWFGSNSALLNTLKQQMESDPEVQGLMVRFSTFLTFYDKNGIFNDYPPVTSRGSDQSKLSAMYKLALENSSEIFFNPAYSNVAGTLGLWRKGEFPTAPCDRRLICGPDQTQVKVKSQRGSDVAVPLGVTLAQLQGTNLALDVSNTFPFNAIDPNVDIPEPFKFDLGTLSVGVNLSGSYTEIAELKFDQYNQQMFDRYSGLIDLSISPEHATLAERGELQLRQADKTTVLLDEQLYVAEIVQSGTFVDVGERTMLDVMVQYKGKPAPNTSFWVAQYSNAYNITTSDYYLNFDDPQHTTDFVLYTITNGTSSANLPKFADAYAGASSPGQYSRTKSAATIVDAQDSSSTTEVSYREVASSPVGIMLDTNVAFDGEQLVKGVLDNEQKTPITYRTVKLTTGADGTAKLGLSGEKPGFPALKISFAAEPEFAFSFSYTQAYIDFMAPIRVLPNDPTLVDDFINYWNGIYLKEDAAELIWQAFIYPKVLRVFYYLYPIMDKYMPLDQRHRIEGAVDQLITLISTEYREESTLAMPITRDLPASSRAVLELWANKLVKRNYPPMPLSSGG